MENNSIGPQRIDENKTIIESYEYIMHSYKFKSTRINLRKVILNDNFNRKQVTLRTYSFTVIVALLVERKDNQVILLIF